MPFPLPAEHDETYDVPSFGLLNSVFGAQGFYFAFRVCYSVLLSGSTQLSVELPTGLGTPTLPDFVYVVPLSRG